MEGYCLKCLTKREIQNAVSVTFKNGRPATKAHAPSVALRSPASVSLPNTRRSESDRPAERK